MTYTRKSLLYYIYMAGRMNCVKFRGKRQYLVNNNVVIKSRGDFIDPCFTGNWTYME